MKSFIHILAPPLKDDLFIQDRHGQTAIDGFAIQYRETHHPAGSVPHRWERGVGVWGTSVGLSLTWRLGAGFCSRWNEVFPWSWSLSTHHAKSNIFSRDISKSATPTQSFQRLWFRNRNPASQIQHIHLEVDTQPRKKMPSVDNIFCSARRILSNLRVI